MKISSLYLTCALLDRNFIALGNPNCVVEIMLFTLNNLLMELTGRTSQFPITALLSLFFLWPSLSWCQGKNQIAVRNGDGSGLPGIVVMIYEKGQPWCDCALGFCIASPFDKATTDKNGFAKFDKDHKDLKPNTDYVASINVECRTPQEGCQSGQQCSSNASSTPFTTDKKGKFDGFSIKK